MHPFHMLGKLYASPTVHDTLFFSTLWGFWVPRNLTVEKSRFETCLNGGSSLVLSFCAKRPTHRKLVQNAANKNLQQLCCINTSEGSISENNKNNPVPNRMAPRQLPGVYIILCLVNNKRYVGESRNVSARLSQHKSRLRRNIHEIPELQRDFNIYGEENFIFSPIWMDKNSTPEERSALEIEFIGRFYSLCYNKFSKRNRKGENNLFCGRTHSTETVEQISRTLSENYKNKPLEGFAIQLYGVIYPSITEASRKTKHSRDTIRRWLNDPSNLNCIAVDSSQPRNTASNLNSSEVIDPNTGFAKKN